jgi:hypothetical protein
MLQTLKVASLTLAVTALAVVAWFRFQPTVKAQDNLTPGMLFGPLSLGLGETAQLCFSYLTEGEITATIHFRNITTGETSSNQTVLVKAGGGGCASYVGQGMVVGLARGDGKAADWVSPSNALIGTMSVVNNGRAGASVVGIPKIWLKGL